MSHKPDIKEVHNMDKFVFYIGVQGVIAILLFAGYVYASVTGVTLPDNYTELLSLVIGYYFAKNGVGFIQAVRSIEIRRD